LVVYRAFDNLLVSHEEIVGALGVVKLAGWLPSELLGQIIEASLKKSDKFTEEDLLHAAPPSLLVAHVPLDYLWDKVVVPLIAEAHDYVAKSGDAKPAEVKAPEADGGWSLRPSDDPSQKSDIKLPGDDGDLVLEDEIIETDDEIRASEPPIGMRKTAGKK
jgi:hypothetical protein